MTVGTFFVLFVSGIVAGLLFGFGKLIKRIFFCKIIPTTIIDFFVGIAICGVFFFSEYLFLNFVLSFYGVLAFVFGIVLEQITIGYLLAKYINIMYNWAKGAKDTKIGARILKWLLK